MRWNINDTPTMITVHDARATALKKGGMSVRGLFPSHPYLRIR